MIKNSYLCVLLLSIISIAQSTRESELAYETLEIYGKHYKHYLTVEFKNYLEALENVAHADTEYRAASKKFFSTHMQPNPANKNGFSDAIVQINEDYQIIEDYCTDNPNMEYRFSDQLEEMRNVIKKAESFALENLPNTDSKEDQELYFDAKKKLENAFEDIHAFEKRYVKYIPSNNTILFNEREVNSFKSICDYKSIIQTCRNFNKSFEREFKDGVFMYYFTKYLITRCFSRKLNEYNNENTTKFANIKKYLLLKDEFNKILTTGNLLIDHETQNETKILNIDFCIFKEMIYNICDVKYSSPDNFRPTPEFIAAAKDFKIFKEKALEIIGKASDFNEMRNAFISVKNDFFALKQKISDIQVPELEIRSLIDLYRWSYQNHLNKAIFLLSVISEKFEIVNQRRIPRPNRSCCKKEIKNCYFCF